MADGIMIMTNVTCWLSASETGDQQQPIQPSGLQVYL